MVAISRLQDIKERLNDVFLKLGRSSSKTQLTNDLLWLLKQAEQKQQLEEILNTVHNELAGLHCLVEFNDKLTRRQIIDDIEYIGRGIVGRVLDEYFKKIEEVK